MDLPAFRALLTPAGQQTLAAAEALAPREVEFLAHFQRLSRSAPPELARAALETAILRREAQVKFPFAERLYFTRSALEQATAYPVALYRAERYQGFQRVYDLGCSIGGDAFALALSAPVVGLDRDPLRLALAQANLRALGLPGALVQADLRAPLPFELQGSGLFFDPARRAQGRRLFSVQDYQPPLAVVNEWLARTSALGVKISPGVKLDELAPYACEVEFISLHGELKEAALWFGPLRSAERRATLLPGPHTLAAQQPYDPQVQELPLGEPRAWLYEPDPAVLRAGLVQDLGFRLGAVQLDRDIAYLTAEAHVETPFARAWRVEAWFPFGLKRLRAELRARGVGRVTVKKRGSPLQPEALIRDLRLKGEAQRVVFLTHLDGQPIVILAFEPFAH